MTVLCYDDIKDNPTKLLALTSHHKAEIELELLPKFEQVYHRQEVKRRVFNRKRQRRIGAGRTAILTTSLDKLFFILVYLKTYPLQTVLAVQFGMSQSQANLWIQRLLPVLQETLAVNNYLPERDPQQVEEAIKRAGETSVIIDGTERPCLRPTEYELQRLYYSGKSKAHTYKNIIITPGQEQTIIYLSKTYEGKKHDKAICDEEGLTFQPQIVLLKDTGFQGYEPGGVISLQPRKKPRLQERPLKDKILNRAISSSRVNVEHALSGVKRLRIVKDIFRNLTLGLEDLVMEIACGLHNLRVKCRYPHLPAFPLLAYFQ